jgi:hypothetical protein
MVMSTGDKWLAVFHHHFSSPLLHEPTGDEIVVMITGDDYW